MKHTRTVAAILVVALCTTTGCRKKLGNLTLDVYIHPESGTPDDILLTTTIRKEFANNPLTANGVYVHVLNLHVVLAGTVSTAEARDAAYGIADAAKIVVNNVVITRVDVANLIKVQK